MNSFDLLDSLLEPKCKQKQKETIEQIFRDIINYCDKYYLSIKLNKDPIISDNPQYTMYICRFNKISGKFNKIIFKQKSINILDLLFKVRKNLIKYEKENKEYVVQEPGGMQCL